MCAPAGAAAQPAAAVGDDERGHAGARHGRRGRRGDGGEQLGLCAWL